MSQVTKHYFVAGKEFTQGIYDKWKETQGPLAKVKKEILEKYKADALQMRGDRACGFAIEINENDKPIDKRGLNVHKTGDGKTFYAVYTANKRFKEGKALAKDLSDYNETTFKAPGFSKFVVKYLGIHSAVVGFHAESRSRTALYSSAAGIAKKQLVLVIPIGGYHDNHNNLPILPPELKEIKYSEFIALTEE